ncbi:hypothetical protein MLD38_023973 [Melastoma candidum]|uniref:Uncharacterized protein n=1 Tax=Melastoma candidum TaxID=119954 RepID=A0ACB9NRR0_9MYRT|nr:hypothetical protein MLD38_023973 [Melastoma candidum]
MAEPSQTAPSPTNSICIVGPQYCLPYPIDVGIVKKVMTISDGNFVVTDGNGNILFKVKGVLPTFIHERRVMMDAMGNPVVTLRRKFMTAHYRWQVFRGESTEQNDMLFSAKTSSILYLKTKLHVFLANNVTEDVCDFRVEGSWFDRSCVVYLGETSTVVAQMKRKHTVGSVLIGKDNYMVTVHPNIDYAFMVAVIVILDEINHTGRQS